jgi:hypothetical protein
MDESIFEWDKQNRLLFAEKLHLSTTTVLHKICTTYQWIKMEC